jgi:thymidylate synthase
LTESKFAGIIVTTHINNTEKIMSRADDIFIENMKDIMENGVWDTDREVRPKWSDGQSAHTIKKFGIVNRYDLSKEFPILTIRRTYFKSCIDELLWIWQKKSNNIKDLHSKIWNQWADENGSIGKAYGYQLGVKHQYKEGEFDQVDRVLYDLKHNPASRRILTNIYNFADLHEMNLYPCAYSMTFNVSGNTLNGILNQRSNDMLTANNWNVVQYAVLLIMFAQVSGLKAGELVHVIADAHIYDRHIPIVKEIIEMPRHTAPKLVVDESITNFYDFTVDSFKLEGYECNDKKYDIPVAE